MPIGFVIPRTFNLIVLKLSVIWHVNKCNENPSSIPMISIVGIVMGCLTRVICVVIQHKHNGARFDKKTPDHGLVKAGFP